MSLKEYSELDGLGISDLVRRREISAMEVVDRAISLAEKYDDTLNAVTYRTYEAARATAEKVDRGEIDGPFAGVPLLIKDMGTHLEGTPSTLGSKYLSEFVSSSDDILIGRYKKSGVSILGKSNVPEMGLVVTTESQLFGPARNPWNLDYSTGGSSGGSAAAVAAGIVPIAHAGDGGGSIRIPASFCGLVGLKPSRARISQGPVIGEMMGGLSNDHILSRTVRDCAAMLDATAGPICGDPYEAPPPAGTFLKAAQSNPTRLRVALCNHSWSDDPVDPEVQDLVAKVGRHLQELGHIVEEVELGNIRTRIAQPFRVLFAVSTAISLENLARVVGRPPGADEIEPHTRSLYELGKQYTAYDYVAAWQSIYRLGYKVSRTTESFDVLVTPTMAKAKLKLGVVNTMESDLEGISAIQAPYSMYTSFFNGTGQPAMSLPLGETPDGFPIGVQFVAHYAQEETLFSLAGQLERTMPWKDRKPSLWA